MRPDSHYFWFKDLMLVAIVPTVIFFFLLNAFCRFEKHIVQLFLSRGSRADYTIVIILNSMVVKLNSDINEKPENIAVIKRKIEAYREALERILGVPKGSLEQL